MLGIAMVENTDIFELLDEGNKEGDENAQEILTEFQFAIKDIGVVSKHMHIVANCEGMILWLRSLSVILGEDHKSQQQQQRNALLFSTQIPPGNKVPEMLFRSLYLAKEKLTLALTIPDNVKTILTLGKVEYLLGVYGLSKGYQEKSEQESLLLDHLEGMFLIIYLKYLEFLFPVK